LLPGKQINDLKIITKKPIIAGTDEVKRNPRSRSAKLRVAEKKEEI
jgi:16S rRNA (cytosine1402-N4)-methyltransferase